MLVRQRYGVGARVSAKSRNKGAAGEREVVALAVECGFPNARRGAPMQSAGGEALADVDGVPGLWAEVKRHHHVQVPRLARELVTVERPGFTPVLFSRDDGGPWLATLDARELLHRHRELLDLRREVARLQPAAERDVWDGPEPLPAGKDLEARRA